eukprot:scpid83433/ scgid11152/ Isochorismatase domain-containing protein 1
MAMAARATGRLQQSGCMFFLCDMQEKFKPSIRYFDEITTVSQRLTSAAAALEIPLIVTEQYPKGLGRTVVDIDISKAAVRAEKTKFSMVVPEVTEFLQTRAERKTVVLFGIEAHVCVTQTALDLTGMGYTVHVVADAASSRSNTDRMMAFDRLRQSGVFVTTSEAVLFELLGDSKAPHFKEVQGLIKVSAPDTGLPGSKM